MKRLLVLLVVLLIVVGGVAYLYLPRGGLTAEVAAALSILNTDITAAKSGGDFNPALDGDLLRDGDVVKSSTEGRGVLTFFDGSSLTFETGTSVRVTTLEHLTNGGIKLTIEQSLGRSWASVSKLKTPDSKFEIRTPTSAAVVRGTAFETAVDQRADGTFSVTYKVDEGEVVVSASAGGQTTVTPNTQVTIATGQQAPAAATPIPPSPALRITSSPGVAFAATAPSGGTCGSAVSRAEIPGCVVNGNVLTIRGPVAGRYALLMSTAAAASGASVKIEALRGATVEATQTFARTFAAGDLVRSAFVYGLAAPQTIGAPEPAEAITSACDAEATGKLFSKGTVQERYDGLEAFGLASRNQAASIVVRESELIETIQAAVEDSTDASGAASLKDLRVKIDTAGLHVSGGVATPVGTFSGGADVIAGPVNGKLVLRLRNLSANPLPGVILDQLQGAFETAMNEFTARFPMVVRRVAMRAGCLGVMGTTPQ
ncbi:MAG TPA: FecR domain-containing protein [Candidatus Limnocylindrales bacterium]|nr:FecR domain-containing protein [Candidatus Limnocylindrales bacterium]